MSGAVGLIVLVPLLLSLVPTALPRAAGPRGVAMTGLGMAVVTAGVAVGGVWTAGDAPLEASGALFGDDALARALSLPPAIAWLLVALREATQARVQQGGTAGRWARWPIAAQLGTAASMALSRLELLALLPIGFALLLAAWSRLEGRDWRDGVSGLAPLLAMLAGVVVLSAGLGRPARWSALSAHDTLIPAALAITGATLLTMPALLLALWSAVHPVRAVRDPPARGLSALLFAAPALGIALRAATLPLSPAGSPVGSPLGSPLGSMSVLTGLAWIGVSVALLPSRRLLAERVALCVSIQLGAVLVGIGAGGAGGIAGGLLLLGMLSALGPVALASARDRAQRRLRRTAIAALVGVPPFASFAALQMLLPRLFAPWSWPGASLAPWSGMLVLAAIGAGAVSVLDPACRDRPVGDENGSAIWLVCGIAVLAVALWFGLAMPAALSDWLLVLADNGV